MRENPTFTIYKLACSVPGRIVLVRLQPIPGVERVLDRYEEGNTLPTLGIDRAGAMLPSRWVDADAFDALLTAARAAGDTHMAMSAGSSFWGFYQRISADFPAWGSRIGP